MGGDLYGPVGSGGARGVAVRGVRAVQAGECWLSMAEGVYLMSAGIHRVFPKVTVPAPGGWLDAGLRAWCGM